MKPSVLILSQLTTKLISMPVPNPPEGERSFLPATHQVSASKRELYLFSRGQPRTALFAPWPWGVARGSGCVLDLPPTRSRAASGLFNPTLGARAGDGLFDRGGAKACETQHASPSPGFKALNQLLSSSPGAPSRSRGETTRCQMAAARHPPISLPHFPQTEQSSPPNDAFCPTADQK